MGAIKNLLIEKAEKALSGKVMIVGDVDRRSATDYIRSLGGEVVTAFSKATALLLGDFPADWENRKCRFGAQINPIDAYDYVADGHCSFGEDSIIHAFDIGLE